ncbi:MAG: hypothetical protein J6Y02_20745 [Pseudobutyrivibrio sp.]|nr:hypothetical protein [Pseudobutyrivibrio sp.]
MKTPNYVFDDELYHHGILGQRWGHRRFQNEDGSWTPEGRERYGEGDERSKAKISYNTQKYKADLKSKARQDKDVRAAKEERNRIKQAAKTERLARKEQAKIERKQARLDKKLANEQTKAKDDVSLKNKLVRTKRYAMSDDELSKAIDRLKLEVEYNKQYALAAKPNGTLARADRFFSGPTGQFVKDVAVQTIPKVAETATKQILENKLKYANKEDRDKINADIEKVKSEIRSKDAETKQKEAGVKSTKAKTDEQKADTIRKDNESKAKIDRENRESEAKIKNNSSAQAMENWRIKQEQSRLNNQAKLDEEVRRAEEFGYDPGSRFDKSADYVHGRLAWKYGSNGSVAQEQETNKKLNSEKVAYEQAKVEALKSKTERENAEAELGRRLTEGTFNGVANLVSQGKSEEARKFQEISSKIKIGSFSGSVEIKGKYDDVISKETTSKPISSLALPSSTNVSESRIESLRSSGMTLREIAEKEHVSTSTIADILYGKKKK